MFKRGLLIVLAVVLVLGLGSCNLGGNATYRIATYRLSQAAWSAIGSNWASSDVWNHIQQSGYTLGSSQDRCSLNDVREFMRTRSFDDNEINSFTNTLQSRGTAWWKYENRTNNYYWVLYANRE